MSNSIVFIDAGVSNYPTLLPDLGADVEVHVLNTQKEGVLQMAAVLANRSDLTAVHIISHGNSGSLTLGATVLNSDNLDNYAHALTQLGASLSATGDILLYGCDVAQGDAGLQFINQLSKLTSADVAASIDLTGATNLGGDWLLEANTGTINTASFASVDYNAVLNAPDLITGLGGAAGFGEDSLGRNDDNASDAIDITSVFGAKGVNFGGALYTKMFVNNNGMITFGTANHAYRPADMSNSIAGQPKIALYWSDLDTSNDNVINSVGGTSTGTNLVYWDVDTVNQTITITWDDVAEYDNGAVPIIAGQIILHNAGSNNVDITMLYEHTAGFVSHTTTAGWNAGIVGGIAGVDYYAIPNATGTTSGDKTVLADLDSRVGNTGIVGTWHFQPQGAGTSYIDTAFVDDFATRTGILSNDFSAGATLTYSITGGTDNGTTVSKSNTYGTLTVIKATGAYSFTPSNTADMEALGVNIIDESLIVTVFDNAAPTQIHSKAFTVSIIQSGVTETTGNDYLVGTTADDTFDALAGNDVINGGLGADSMTGGLGNDVYYVDNVGDTVIETSNLATEIDRVHSSISYTLGANVEKLILTGTAAINGTGNTLNNALTGNNADNVLTGGAGNDWDYYYNAGAGVTANLSITTAQDTVGAGLDTLVGIENLLGSRFNDSLTGNNGNNVLSGGDGNDVIDGDAGIDWLTYHTATAGVNVDLSITALQNTGGAGSDTLSNIENLNGSPYADILKGDSGKNVLKGNDGSDILRGNAGNDVYLLQETVAATDTLKIAAGDSVITGRDMVRDFSLGTGTANTTGVDKLDLPNTLIAANGTGNGVDVGVAANAISSHRISNGMISFDSSGAYDTPVAVTNSNLINVLHYLQTTIANGQTVAFVSDSDTLVFQGGAGGDSVIELLGVTAHSVNTSGLAANAVWIA